MHRSVPLALLVTTTLAVPAVAAQPAAHGRSATGSYTGAGVDSVAGITPSVYGEGSGQGTEFQAVSVDTRRTDRRVTVRVTDRSGRPVQAAVVQHLGSGTSDDVELGRLCGPRNGFRLARPGRPLTVYLLAGRCGASASVPTTGTVRFTFTPR
jgi:hypothetical protein